MAILLAIIAMTVPVLGFFLTLSYFNQYKQVIPSALLCGLSFSAAIYGYIPDAGNDIFRHISNMKLYMDIPFWDAFDFLKTDASHLSGVYVWDAWLWIIAQVGNQYLLQASGAFVGYAITTYMVFDYAKKKQIPSKKWLPMLLFFLAFTSPTNLSIGIRSGNAFLISVLALYRFYIEKATKGSTLLLFLLAFFLHHSIIVIIAIWLAFPILIRFKALSIIFIVAGLTIFSDYENYLYLLASSGMDSTGALSNTMYSASVYQSMDFNNSVHAITDLVWRLFCAGFLLYLSRKLILFSGDNSSDGKVTWEYKLYHLSLFIYILSITFVPLIGNNGMRFINVVYLLCLLILMNDKFRFWGAKKESFPLSSALLIIICVGNVMFFAYNMNWGSGSLKSFAISSLLGYSSRIFFDLQ